VVLVEEAVDMDEVDHNQDMDKEVGDDKDQDVEAGAAGSYRLEDQDDSDMLRERDPYEEISCVAQVLLKAKGKHTEY
jgi:hypothetical protein